MGTRYENAYWRSFCRRSPCFSKIIVIIDGRIVQETRQGGERGYKLLKFYYHLGKEWFVHPDIMPPPSLDHCPLWPTSLNDISNCKIQNSGLRSKEEKPRDPMNQPSRCNTQEGLLSVAQTGDSDLLGGRAHLTANWASFLYAKKT